MTQPNNIEIKINNLLIKKSHEVKFLGITLDCKLTWKSHIEEITNKLCKVNGIIHKIKNACNKKCLLQIYNSLLYPNLIYCCAIWGGAYKTYLNNLTINQKKLIRNLTNSKRLEHTAPLFRELKLLKIVDIISYQSILFVYKSLNIYPLDCGFQHSPQHNIHTRNSNDLTIPLFHTSHAQQSITFRGTKLWNDISTDTKRKSLFTVKRILKENILQSY